MQRKNKGQMRSWHGGRIEVNAVGGRAQNSSQTFTKRKRYQGTDTSRRIPQPQP